MTYSDYKYLVLSDLHRITGSVSRRSLWRSVFLGGAFRYSFWMRTCAWMSGHSILRLTLYPFARLVLQHYVYKFGIDIPHTTQIGPGFYIGHFSGIIVNGKSIIGRDVNISQGVTLGRANRGSRRGTPVIGDRVYIGPGVKIVGSVKVGNNVAIGANCVITSDIPDSSVVVGVPGKVISNEGSQGYITRTDYDAKLGRA